MVRKTFLLLGTLGSFATSLLAGTPILSTGKDSKTPATPEEPVPLELFSYEFNFVNSASLRGAHGGLGDQNVISSDFEASHRFHIKDNIYARVGVEYTRFDFGTVQGPTPNHLQSFSMPIALEYIQQGFVGAAIEINPGFWFQNQISGDAFDIPWRAYLTVPLKDKKLYAVVGAAGADFYSLKVFPIGGLIWIISDTVRLEGVFPKPELVYQPNDAWEYRLGGELQGGGYRVDSSEVSRYNRTVVEYVDYHAGAQVNYKGLKGVTIGVGGGWSLQREFDYFRSDKRFKANGAPYAKLELSAEF